MLVCLFISGISIYGQAARKGDKAYKMIVDVPAGRSMEINVFKDAGSMQRLQIFRKKQGTSDEWKRILIHTYKGSKKSSVDKIEAVNDSFVYLFIGTHNVRGKGLKFDRDVKILKQDSNFISFGFDDEEGYSEDYDDKKVDIYFDN